MIWKVKSIGGMIMPFNKSAYDMEYAKAHIKRKHIPFNETNQDDAEMLEWLSKQDNVTQYIKGLIRADMERKESDGH